MKQIPYFYITRDGDNWVYVSTYGRTMCSSLNEAVGLLY